MKILIEVRADFYLDALNSARSVCSQSPSPLWLAVTWRHPVRMGRIRHLPSRGVPKPLWPAVAQVDANDADVGRCWQASCAASTSSTPSACSNRSSAGPHRNCASRPPLTGGLGSCRPRTPSCVSPVPSTRTCAGPGHVPWSRSGSHRPGCVGVSEPSRPGPGRPPRSRNRPTAARSDVGLILVTGQAHQRPAHHQKGTEPRRTG
jgi:hypothetical protein